MSNCNTYLNNWLLSHWLFHDDLLLSLAHTHTHKTIITPPREHTLVKEKKLEYRKLEADNTQALNLDARENSGEHFNEGELRFLQHTRAVRSHTP